MNDPIPTSAAATRPEWVPEKFWDPETGTVRVEDLARSYRELERLMSGNGAALPPALLPAGPPAGPDGYQLDVDDLLDIDADVNQRLFDAGFSNDQAQLVYDLAAERLMPMVKQIAGEYEDARQLDRLTRHFGGRERFEALRPQLRAWGEANLPPDVFAALARSAEGVIALHAMMKSGEPGLGQGAAAASGLGEAELKRMMSDPRYWREREPTYVAQVREGFRRLYPEG